MATTQSGWLALLNGLSQGGVAGYQTGKKLADMAAERELKKKEFQLNVEKAASGSNIIDPATGKIYSTEGISPEAKASLLGTSIVPKVANPNVVDVGLGKLGINKPSPTGPVKELLIPRETYDANPEAFQTPPPNSKYKIVEAAKAPVDPAVADAKDGLQQLRKLFLANGSLTDAQAKLANGYAKTVGANVTTEEDKGLMNWFSNNIGSGSNTLIPIDNKANQSKPITAEIAKQYLVKAGGDKAKAKALAKADGYKF